MQHDLEESILDVIDYLSDLSCYPDLLRLCIEQLDQPGSELPSYVFWILDNMRSDIETRVDVALHQVKHIQTLLDVSANDCPLQTPDACLVMRYVCNRRSHAETPGLNEE
jgi:hypothetical protein